MRGDTNMNAIRALIDSKKMFGNDIAESLVAVGVPQEQERSFVGEVTEELKAYGADYVRKGWPEVQAKMDALKPKHLGYVNGISWKADLGAKRKYSTFHAAVKESLVVLDIGRFVQEIKGLAMVRGRVVCL